MKKHSKGTLQTKLSRFLFHYRLTPNLTTGIAPAELMLMSRPRSHLDCIVPGMKEKIRQQQGNKRVTMMYTQEPVLSNKVIWYWFVVLTKRNPCGCLG